MTPDPTLPMIMDGTTKIIEKQKEEPERESWGKKTEFLLSVVGFAVDLGNVWRFPYICFKNGGGAFLLPYLIMLVFGGLPLFYMELALGQFQRCGCLTVWKRICPMFKGVGISICIIATYVSLYYNTIIAWAVYFFFSSFRAQPPWLTCNNTWNTENCTTFSERVVTQCKKTPNQSWNMDLYNGTTPVGYFNCTSVNATDDDYSSAASTEFFEREVLEMQYSMGLESVGGVKWTMSLCLMSVFLIVYFALWKGIKSSGKAVWVTAILPYVVLIILLIRGSTLPGAMNGILYFIEPKWEKLMTVRVWIDAAAQIFFSLGPGFGVLLALSSYNKFNNNCYKDALATSAINCGTSLLAGFAVFTVLGYMAHAQNKSIDEVARPDVGLIFVVYPEAIATIDGSSFWAIIFFFMLITLGLDTTFGGLEAIITGILDEWPWMRKKREIFVILLMCYCFLGGLATTTYGGIYVVQLFDVYAAPISILLVVFLEAVAVSWIYGVKQFSKDIESMLGKPPGIFWQICWAYISPVFLLTLFILSVYNTEPPAYGNYVYPFWSLAIGWLMVLSALLAIPIYFVIHFLSTKGTMMERMKQMIFPNETPRHISEEGIRVYL
ncbi:sodium-dependent serotonin transporter [Patella vulgata]|uniref:sodium-dependent serotonin transporter n=1 Tax=Patella vulgata TaxID=6465 RepID=UPI0021802455|nr:sodium-dependent serotonin transporter [Patella vulgata]